MSWLPEGRSLANFDLVPAVGTTTLDRCTQQRRMHRAEVIFACVTPGSKHKHKTQGRTAPASSPVTGARLNYGKYLRRKYIAVARCMSARQALLHFLAAACVCPLQGVNLPSTSFITATRPRGAATWPRAEACGVGTPSRSKCPPRVRAEVWSEGKINGARGQEQALFQCLLAGARWEAKEAAQMIQESFGATGRSRLQVFSVDIDGILANIDARIKRVACVFANVGDSADVQAAQHAGVRVQVRQNQWLSPIT